ncbi:MAG: hypothetical protein KDC12_07990 [Flavobacteriales bacterium]|nr:hypothetical protein [Flavobacteriales bacterium]
MQLLLGETGFSIKEIEGGFIMVSGGTGVIGNPSIFYTVIDNNGAIQNLEQYGALDQGWFAGWGGSLDIKDEKTILCGSVDYNDSPSQFLAVSTDLNGDTLWTKILSSAEGLDEIGSCSIFTSDGGLLMCGSSYDFETHTKGLVIKTDSLGNEQWRSYHSSDDLAILYQSLSEVPGVGYYVGTTRSSSFDYLDMGVTFVDYNGVIGESFWVDNEYHDSAANVFATSDGNILQGGEFSINDGSAGHAFLRKLTPDGDVLWSNIYGPFGSQNFFSTIAETAEGDYVAAGSARSPDLDLSIEGLICKVSQEGDSLWYRHYVNISGDLCLFWDMEIADNGDITCIGATIGNAELQLSQDTWVVHLDEHGCLVPGCHVGIEEFEESDTYFSIGPVPAQDQFSIFMGRVPNKGLKVQIISPNGQSVDSFWAHTRPTTYIVDCSSYTAGIYTVVALSENGKVLQSERLIVQ